MDYWGKAVKTFVVHPIILYLKKYFPHYPLKPPPLSGSTPDVTVGEGNVHHHHTLFAPLG